MEQNRFHTNERGFERCGLTIPQKAWIDRRDQGCCHFELGDYICPSSRRKGVRVDRHHIIPQSFFKEEEWYLQDNHPDKNCPTNIISLCEYHHMMLHDKSWPHYKQAFRELSYELKKIATRQTLLYLRDNPDDQFPEDVGYSVDNFFYDRIRIS